MSLPIAIVFRQHLLPLSETFVRYQSRSLQRFQPLYVGLKRVSGLALPNSATLTLGFLAAKIFRLTSYAPRFIRKLGQLQPSVIHAHFEDGGLLALPIAKALGIPLITTFHGYDATMDDSVRQPNPLLRWLLRRRREHLKREGDLFIAVSEFIREKLLKRGYPAEKIVTHPIGIDLGHFTPASGTRSPLVLFVGRLVEKKGCAFLLEAMKTVFALRPDAQLLIIGDGPLRSSLEKLAADYRLTNFCFAGANDSAFVRMQMSRASLLVVPSVTAATGDSEGLPTVICEAQAMGLPVVGTRHAGIPEAVVHNETGFLVEERSVDELAERILQLLNDNELRESFAKAARTRVEEHFDLRIQTEKLESLYDAAVTRKTTNGAVKKGE
jgi:colanic acid/amylovoran biosynthesis glycosyltransferase